MDRNRDLKTPLLKHGGEGHASTAQVVGRDRLESLRRIARVSFQKERCETVEISCQEPASFRALKQQVDKVSSSIADMRLRLQEVKQWQNQILATPQPKSRDQDNLDRCVRQLNQTAQSVTNLLKGIKGQIAKDEELRATNDEQETAESRIRKTKHAALLREFVDVMTDYNDAQVTYRERCKERLQRQLEITNCKAGSGIPEA